MKVKDKDDATTKPGYPYVKTTRKDESIDEVGGSGSYSDYHTGPWTFGVGGPDRGGHDRDVRAATRGGLDSPDSEPGSQPPSDWPKQWVDGTKKLNLAYNKEESAIAMVLAGHTTCEALDLVEASSWVPTDYKSIDQAIKMSVQARAVKHNWKIVKQSRDYALAVSLWGPKREFKLVQPSGSNVTYTGHTVVGGAKAVVMTRSLDAHERGEQE
jgi:hypothetical protein